MDGFIVEPVTVYINMKSRLLIDFNYYKAAGNLTLSSRFGVLIRRCVLWKTTHTHCSLGMCSCESSIYSFTGVRAELFEYIIQIIFWKKKKKINLCIALYIETRLFF